jgi:hypothetical protein
MMKPSVVMSAVPVGANEAAENTSGFAKYSSCAALLNALTIQLWTLPTATTQDVDIQLWAMRAITSKSVEKSVSRPP